MMKRMLQRRVLPVLLFGLFASSVFADGPVWKLSDGKNHLLLGGTIHMLAQEDYPLPPSFDQGYKGADILVFEIDPDMASSPEAQQKFAQYAQYDDGRTLKTVLSKKVYRQLDVYLQERGLSINAFATFKPSMLSVVLTVVELQRLGLAGVGVDEFFSQRAKQDGKQRLFLESIDDQFAALMSSDEGKEDETIIKTLDELERMPSMMRKTKEAWRKGDNTALKAVALEPWMNEFPQMYQALLVDRNHRWLPQIKDLMKTPEVEYVLVGALHLVGPDGLLALMKAQGYELEQLK